MSFSQAGWSFPRRTPRRPLLEKTMHMTMLLTILVALLIYGWLNSFAPSIFK